MWLENQKGGAGESPRETGLKGWVGTLGRDRNLHLRRETEWRNDCSGSGQLKSRCVPLVYPDRNLTFKSSYSFFHNNTKLLTYTCVSH